MDMDSIKHIYDSNAVKYKEATKDFDLPDNALERFVECLAGKKVLDLGCAYGRELLRLHNQGFNVQGIEFSSGLIDIAYPEIKSCITLGDITKLLRYFPEDNFYGILSLASIVHMQREDGMQVIRDSYKLLHTGGIFLLSIKTSDKTYMEIKESISTDGVSKPYIYYSKQDIKSILEEIGFEIIYTHSHYPIEDEWSIYLCRK